VEELLDEPELPIPSDERRLEACGLEGAGASGGDAECAEESDRLRLALQLVHACVLVGDRGLGGALGRLADEDGARLCSRLDARGRVDEVAGDHAFPRGAERDRSLACEDACPRLQSRSELGDCRDEVEGGPHRPLGVVLVCDGRAPDGHHGVADELLDRTAVALDHRPRRVEIAGEQLPRVLRVARLGEGREADQVGEEDGDEPALCRPDVPGGGFRHRATDERRAALTAELHAGRVRGATGRAGSRQQGAAFAAELAAALVLASATRTEHGNQRSPMEEVRQTAADRL